jgi:acyl-CoA reductase-like NAD-dependent aldehyde dehydrogenase
VRVPVGVVGAITPFNFPLNLVAHKLAPAIAAGCPVVLKPAHQTPLTGIKLAELLLERCGLPRRGSTWSPARAARSAPRWSSTTTSR